jgi:DNA-directed RNA polymerase subunit beta
MSPSKAKSSAKAKPAVKAKLLAKTEKPKAMPVANSIESFTGRKRVRRNFGRIEEVAQMPNLIEVQRDSYEQFLQQVIDARMSARSMGLHKVLSEVSRSRILPAVRKLISLNMNWKSPNTMWKNARQRGMTYAAPLRVTLRLSVLMWMKIPACGLSATLKSKMFTWWICR